MARVSTDGTRRVRWSRAFIAALTVGIASTALVATLNTNDHGRKATPPDGTTPSTSLPRVASNPPQALDTIPSTTVASFRYRRSAPTPIGPPVVAVVLPPSATSPSPSPSPSPSTTEPTTSPSTTEPPIPQNPNVAVVVTATHVRVLPGTAQFMTDPTPGVAPEGFTRIFSGKVLYAVGDNRTWQLVAVVSGANGYRTTSTCGSLNLFLAGDGPRVTPGPSVIVGSDPVVICQGIAGHRVVSFRHRSTSTVRASVTSLFASRSFTKGFGKAASAAADWRRYISARSQGGDVMRTAYPLLGGNPLWLNSMVTGHDLLLGGDSSLLQRQCSRSRLCSRTPPTPTTLARPMHLLRRQATACMSPLSQRHCRCSRPTERRIHRASQRRGTLLHKRLTHNQLQSQCPSTCGYSPEKRSGSWTHRLAKPLAATLESSPERCSMPLAITDRGSLLHM